MDRLALDLPPQNLERPARKATSQQLRTISGPSSAFFRLSHEKQEIPVIVCSAIEESPLWEVKLIRADLPILTPFFCGKTQPQRDSEVIPSPVPG